MVLLSSPLLSSPLLSSSSNVPFSAEQAFIIWDASASRTSGLLKLFRQSREGNCIPVFYGELKRFKKCELLILSGFILMSFVCVGWGPSVLHLCVCVCVHLHTCFGLAAWFLCVYLGWGCSGVWVGWCVCEGLVCVWVRILAIEGILCVFSCRLFSAWCERESAMKMYPSLCRQKHIKRDIKRKTTRKAINMFRQSQWSHFLPWRFLLHA